MNGAVKACLPDNARWEDDDTLVLMPPEDLEEFAADQSWEDWGVDR